MALLTSPACFLIFRDSNHLGFVWSVVLTALVVLLFRGLVEVITRHFIPWPSLLGANAELKQEDIMARRRYWFWRTKYRRLPYWIVAALILLALCQLLFAFAGVHAGFFNPIPGLRQIFPVSEISEYASLAVQIPLLLFANVLIFMGPLIFMAARAIRSYEPEMRAGA